MHADINVKALVFSRAAYLGQFSKGENALLIFFLGLTAFFSFYGTRVPVADGLGWVGQAYGKCAIDLAGCVRSQTLSAYSLGRLFPSALMSSIFSVLQIEANPAVVVKSFAVWNLLVVWLSLALWIDSARRQRWEPQTIIFGVIALFFCFSVIRFPFYSPVSTDATALLFASFGLWCFAAKTPWLCLASVLPAGFTWPIAIPVLASVVIFKGTDRGERWESLKFLPALCVLLFLFAAGYFLFVSPKLQPYGSAQIVYTTLPISLSLSTIYVFWAARGLGIVPPIRSVTVNIPVLIGTAVIVAIYLIGSIVLSSYSGPASAMSAEILLRGLTVTGLVYPGLFLVAHVVFLGPWVLVFVAMMPKIMARITAPLYPVLALFLIFMLLIESRGMTFFLPFAVYALCATLDRSLERKRVFVFAVLSLMLSRFWLPMESGPFSNLLEFPAQILFMHIGPWMGWFTYIIGVLQLCVACVAVWALFSVPK